MTDHLLQVEDLHVEFPTQDGVVHAVGGVTFHLDAGETLGVVGESGCGKSVTALSIMRLVPRPGRITRGSIRFMGKDLAAYSESEMEAIRGDRLAMIFQDPMTSLNPLFPIGWQVAEPLRLHRHLRDDDALRDAMTMLGRVGIPEPQTRAKDYPHQFSGGMRQRAMIAMGLTTSPAVLIADEPTTALDVTIQAQIVELLKEINQDFGTATMVITHNLGLVAGMCDRVQVMYAGKIVETGKTEHVLREPQHPYTWALLRSMPKIDGDREESLTPIEGMPPDLIAPPSGCRFHPRCPFAMEICAEKEPPLITVGAQRAACWYTQQGQALQ